MPTVIKVGGYRFFFFSNENDEPLHIHVEKAENYAKFWLKPVSLARNIGFNQPEIKEIRKILFENQTLIEEKWNGYFNK
ncbi:MAG TPA: DUF4160 domain-containing protein [bacterium]|nr:DUF4160 domain-containing protein [bacterium]